MPTRVPLEVRHDWQSVLVPGHGWSRIRQVAPQAALIDQLLLQLANFMLSLLRSVLAHILQELVYVLHGVPLPIDEQDFLEFLLAVFVL